MSAGHDLKPATPDPREDALRDARNAAHVVQTARQVVASAAAAPISSKWSRTAAITTAAAVEEECCP
jgi:hypothetical protein